MINWFKSLTQNKRIYWYLLFLGVIALIFIQYYGLVKYQYVVPAGDDPMNHFLMAKPFYDGTGHFWQILKDGGYPPAYHFIIAKIALLFNADLLDTIKWTAPSILVLSSLAIFLLSYSIFGIEAGLIAFILYAFIAKTPIQLLNDGGYPNLIATHILLPLTLTFITLAIKSAGGIKRNKLIIFAVISALLIPITHHATTFYLLSLTLISLPTLTIVFWIKNKWSAKKGLLLLLLNLILYLIIFLIYTQTDLLASARALSSGMIQITTSWPFYKLVGISDPNALWSLRDYISFNGRFFALYSLLGMIAVAFSWRRNNKLFVPLTILFIWSILLFVVSRFPFLTNPERAARDMVVPLAVLAGGGIYHLFQSVNERFGNMIILLFFVIFTISLFSPLKVRLDNATAYEPMVRVTSADMEIINYLNRQKPGKVLIATFNYYAPEFLPNWRIDTNYSSVEIDTNLREYDYLYLQNSKIGWLPPQVRLHMADEYKKKPFLTQVLKEKSPTNEVYLFKLSK